MFYFSWHILPLGVALIALAGIWGDIILITLLLFNSSVPTVSTIFFVLLTIPCWSVVVILGCAWMANEGKKSG